MSEWEPTVQSTNRTASQAVPFAGTSHRMMKKWRPQRAHRKGRKNQLRAVSRAFRVPTPLKSTDRQCGHRADNIPCPAFQPKCYFSGRPATSVLFLSSSEPIVYRQSAPRLGRRPMSRMNRDSVGDSDPSTSTINSPGTNVSRLRVGTSVALNASFTRNLVTGNSIHSTCPFGRYLLR